MSRNVVLLGIDPGFSELGYAAIAFPPRPDLDVFRVEAFGVIRTKKASKKQNVLATEDNIVRAQSIARELSELVTSLESPTSALIGICSESMSWPRNASVTAKMGIAWGVLSTLAHMRRLPILQISPMALKKRIAGRRDASKQEVEDALVALAPRLHSRFGGLTIAGLIASVSKNLREHPVDALGAAVACADAEAVKMARRMAA